MKIVVFFVCRKFISHFVLILLFLTNSFLYADDEVTISGHTVLKLPLVKTKASVLFNKSHYFNVWNMPVNFSILDLKKLVGEKGSVSVGKNNKKNLKIKSNLGINYKFRQIKHELPIELPQMFDSPFLKNMIKGSYMTCFPYAASITSVLEKGVGLLTVDPFLCVLPQDASLGGLEKDFAFMPGYLEFNPKNDSQADLQRFNAEKIVKKKIFKDKNKYQINAYNYLKSRLFDAYIGDWDRHKNQWKWILPVGAKRFLPLPLDRDVAFFDMRGTPGYFIFINITSKDNNKKVHLSSFENQYVNEYGLMFRGVKLDLKILNKISFDDWIKEAEKLQLLLTDKLIDKALNNLPEEMISVVKKDIFRSLISRRNNLVEFAEFYFNMLYNYDYYE